MPTRWFYARAHPPASDTRPPAGHMHASTHRPQTRAHPLVACTGGHCVRGGCVGQRRHRAFSSCQEAAGQRRRTFTARQLPGVPTRLPIGSEHIVSLRVCTAQRPSARTLAALTHTMSAHVFSKALFSSCPSPTVHSTYKRDRKNLPDPSAEVGPCVCVRGLRGRSEPGSPTRLGEPDLGSGPESGLRGRSEP
eukprot:353510-Chlamydomonas_euryale.AAC.9